MGLYDDYDEDKITNNDNADKIGSEIIKSTRKGSKKKKFNVKNLKMPKIVDKALLYVLSIFIAVVIIYALYILLQPTMINYNINPNPIFKTNNTEATLNLNISNVYKNTLKDITIEIAPIDNTSVAVIPSDPITINILGSGEERTITKQISLIGDAPAGKYVIKIKVKSPKEIIEKNIVWEIKNSEWYGFRR